MLYSIFRHYMCTILEASESVKQAPLYKARIETTAQGIKLITNTVKSVCNRKIKQDKNVVKQRYVSHEQDI